MSTENRNRRVLAILALVIAGCALAFLATGGIGENLVYYWSPTELQDAGSKANDALVRLGGLVAPGTVVRGDGLDLRFAVTDGTTTVPVAAQTVPPAMFREGIGVVLEGRMGDDGTFQTQRLMVKHDNEYRAPEEGDDRNVNELVKSLEG